MDAVCDSLHWSASHRWQKTTAPDRRKEQPRWFQIDAVRSAGRHGLDREDHDRSHGRVLVTKLHRRACCRRKTYVTKHVGKCWLARGRHSVSTRVAYFVFCIPNYLGHLENYVEADSPKMPAKIVPEWYFLPFYAILRAVTFDIGPIGSKLGGVLAMFGAIAVLFFVPWPDTSKVRSAVYRPWYEVFFWLFAANALFLGWLGAKPADAIMSC